MIVMCIYDRIKFVYGMLTKIIPLIYICLMLKS